ncbi:glycosyltransferase family 47 protein [Roseitranquillus sediminis]|uniref:glycosyltransferase family 47 protein n=1 Tax=Roseitranquillus sediminis TaxID=2809051 RepID=UPI001D0C9FF8|nr:glycosyltransferase family 47 protein [Roseitranquillus sediminis]MBM9594028.1 hypothetical protein [Roseitranquillus sediminis]
MSGFGQLGHPDPEGSHTLRLAEFLDLPPHPAAQRIYTLRNKPFYYLSGADFLRARDPGRGYHMWFVGSPDMSFDRMRVDRPKLKKLVEEAAARSEACSVVIGKTHFEINDEFVQDLPENVATLVSCNVNTRDPRVLYFPLGCDFRSRASAERTKKLKDRDILCYANFSVDTHPSRVSLAQDLTKREYITCEHMGGFMQYPISRDEFFARLSRSKFAICPRGLGIETYRMWDCLYLGVIPVVKREAVFFDDLEDLPILFVDDWSQFLDLPVSTINSMYEEFLERRFNFGKLDITYWIKRMHLRHIDRFADHAHRLDMASVKEVIFTDPLWKRALRKVASHAKGYLPR